ncbi:hypothetical protein [Clostridium intestinale]|uniref:hypothetical protein n=1 Tax=Clostridium intestinale TaxID=36845 RepID=UPI0028EDEDA8|nr:hypothetical protein [Clostridium intestinale]
MKKRLKIFIETIFVVCLAIIVGLVMNKFSKKSNNIYSPPNNAIYSRGIGIHAKDIQNKVNEDMLILEENKLLKLVLDNETTLSSKNINLLVLLNGEIQNIKINEDINKTNIDVFEKEKKDIILDLNNVELKNDVNIISLLVFTDVNEVNQMKLNSNYIIINNENNSKKIEYSFKNNNFINLNTSDYDGNVTNNTIKRANKNIFIKCSTNLDSLDNLKLISLKNQSIQYKVSDISIYNGKINFVMSVDSNSIEENDYLFLINLNNNGTFSYISNMSNVVKIIK